MIMRILCVLCLLGIIVACQTPQSSLTIEQQADGVWIKEKGHPVLFYQKTAKPEQNEYARSHYFHPLYSLDGTVLTEDMPEDHYHHHGIFWAWHQTYIGDKRIGDAWVNEDFEWRVDQVKPVLFQSGAVGLNLVVNYLSPLWVDEQGQPKPFIEEHTLVQVYPRTDSTRMIDFRIGLRALLPDVAIGGSEDSKGYGGFSLRIKMPDSLTFTSALGPVQPQRDAIKGGGWMDFSAPYEENGEWSGVTLMVHPSSEGFPQPWILRQKKSMQNVAYPGRDPVTVPTDRPLVFKYRLILYKGQTDDINIDALYESFANRVE